MRKLLVVQHVAHEMLGTLNPLLKRAGFRIRYVNFGRQPDTHPSLEGYRGLVVLGGPMSVYEDRRFPYLITEMKLIRCPATRSAGTRYLPRRATDRQNTGGGCLSKQGEGNRLV